MGSLADEEAVDAATGNLLAVIHRDGGHYEESHGTLKALQDAENVVIAMRTVLAELAALVRGECPSLLDEDSGGDAKLSMDIDEALKGKS